MPTKTRTTKPSAESKRVRVFVSYSRTDENEVRRIVEIMRAVEASVFRDVDDLKPGDKWQPTIARAISRCDVFMLFWCAHSKSSDAVTGEWRQALTEKKRVVPVLLDSTPLPTELSEFQWIDLREYTHEHQAFAPPTRPSRDVMSLLVDPTYLAGTKLRTDLWRLLQALPPTSGFAESLR